MNLELIGWIGSILFAICGIPQAYHSYKSGHSNELTWTFLTLWFLGEVFTIIYIFPKRDYPLLFNYSINLMCLIVIFKFKIFPRSK